MGKPNNPMMQKTREKYNKAYQIRMTQEFLNGNNKYQLEFENRNNNKKSESPKSRSPSSKTTKSTKTKTKTTSGSNTTKKNFCFKSEEDLPEVTLDENAPNLSSYQKVLNRVFNSYSDKQSTKLVCLCTMKCVSMLVPKANDQEKTEPEDDLKKRLKSGGCGSSGSSSTRDSKKTGDEDDDDESS